MQAAAHMDHCRTHWPWTKSRYSGNCCTASCAPDSPWLVFYYSDRRFSGEKPWVSRYLWSNLRPTSHDLPLSRILSIAKWQRFYPFGHRGNKDEFVGLDWLDLTWDNIFNFNFGHHGMAKAKSALLYIVQIVLIILHLDQWQLNL